MPHPSIPGVPLVAIALVLLALAGQARSAEPEADSDAAPDAEHLAAYGDTIRPLLAERCFACHGGLRQEAGLRLDTADLMAAGGDSGPAVVKGDPAASLVLARVADANPTTRMPPEGEGEPLSAAQVAAVSAWIAAGAPAPADERPEADPRDHWAFRPRVRPAVPVVTDGAWVRNPIDAFVAAGQQRAGIAPQPEAPRHVLVRRLFIDLIGLPPQPEELAAVLADGAPDWYERLVDRLLDDPRHGERWARHWMDVWRYSDWWGLGDQLRNSQKHMWHFRDWIVESLERDLPYDEMVRRMLAADELYPDDPDALRATGFLARNWFLFNRTPWMDDTVEHVAKGLLGITMNCAKCHAHKYDPVAQEDYYRFRAFFEPLHVRLDVVPGTADLEADGIPRVFDGQPDAPTWLLVRGEDTKPDMSRPISPGVPAVLAFAEVAVAPVGLPVRAFEPERRPWVLEAHVETARRAVAAAEARAREPATVAAAAVAVARAELAAVERRAEAMRAAWAAADAGSLAPEDPLRAAAVTAARAAARAEREIAVAKSWAAVAAVSAKLAATVAEPATGKRDAAALAALEKELATARENVDKATRAADEPGDTFTPLVGARWTPTRFGHSGRDDPAVAFPATSTGRRAALAAWITDPRHPLTARVAANHVWMRHLGRPLVATVFDFGRKGEPPTHPELLDWLASELVEGPPGAGRGWSLRHLHRLIVTSATYRLGSSLAGGAASRAIDPDNRLLWRREPIRLEAQVVRDGILALAGLLDPTSGGPPVPEAAQGDSRRRSLYFWHSDISRNLFLTTFDDAGVKECYQREESIVPQQALALANARIVHDAAAAIADRLAAAGAAPDDGTFIDRAFGMLLQRPATAAERATCTGALAHWRALDGDAAARAHLVWTLFNHTEFVTLR